MKTHPPAPARRWLWLLALCLPALPAPTAAAESTNYHALIHCPPDAAAQSLAQELANLLQRMTGQTFTLDQQTQGPGIHLRVHRPDDAFPELRDADAEAFLLRSAGAAQLFIVGRTVRGLQHGVYAYLEKLGVRWYLPTEHWTLVPPRADLRLQLDELHAPTFAMREFAGTGGFGGSLPLDPQRQLEQRWAAWQRHLRLDGRVAVSGHYGEAFNLKHRKILEANPDMRAEIGGQRQPWDEIGKPCYSNPKLIELYVKDRVEGYAQLQQWYPASPRAFAVSVEPADGGGHCQCASCVALGGVSNRVFTLVNHAARAVAQAHPGGHVSLFAYNEHALPPTFPVADNVLVVVTPYAFQRTGLSPDRLLEQWASRARTIGIYDYWSIPDWSDDLPDFNLDVGMAKVRKWRELGALGALFESSYSSGAIGPLMYLTSRVYWDPQTDPWRELDQFCTGAFGAAAAPMRRMLGRWFEDFLLSDQELALSLQDLLEADRLADTEAVRLRLDDYKRYVHYIRLWHEYLHSAPEQRHQYTDRLIEYCWRIYDSTMIHAFRMTQLLAYRHERADEAHRLKWDVHQGTVDWTSIKPVERAELDRLLADGATRYQPATYERRRYSADLVPLQTPTPAAEGWTSTPTLGGAASFRFHVAAANRPLTLRLACGLMDNRAPTTAVRIRGPQDQVVLDVLQPTDGQTRDLTFTPPQPGSYQLQIDDQKSLFQLHVPNSLPLVITAGLMSGDLSGPLYFFVPQGLKRVALYCPGVIPVEIRDGAGQLVPGPAQGSIILDVPPGQDGTVWSITRFKSWEHLKLLNVPQAVALTRQTMLVPAEVQPKPN